MITAQRLMDLQNEIGQGVVVSVTVSESRIPALAVRLEWRSPGRKDYGMQVDLTRAAFMNDAVEPMLDRAAAKFKAKITTLIE